MRMRVGIRAGLAAGKICTALLLGVALIAVVIPSGGVALSQRRIGSAAQAPLYTPIDLHPRGFVYSEALGVSGEQQVGVGYTEVDHEHALLWRGSAVSVVDLVSSRGGEATANCGGQQVGYGDGLGTSGTERHALLWRGSAARAVDLHPNGFDDSEAHGTSGREQVGFGGAATGGFHALLWRGSAASVVDLHPHGFTESQAMATSGGQQVGYGAGPATRGSAHALLWRGSSHSVADLNPRGFDGSQAYGIFGGRQVGRGSSIGGGGHFHALLWRGSAASVVDLNPRGFTDSEALSTNGEEQVGVGMAAGVSGHALLWRGSADSVVDLHAFLPPSFVFSIATGIDSNGDIVGHAEGPEARSSHAFLWRRNAPKPGTSREQNTMRC